MKTVMPSLQAVANVEYKLADAVQTKADALQAVADAAQSVADAMQTNVNAWIAHGGAGQVVADAQKALMGAWEAYVYADTQAHGGLPPAFIENIVNARPAEQSRADAGQELTDTVRVRANAAKVYVDAGQTVKDTLAYALQASRDAQVRTSTKDWLDAKQARSGCYASGFGGHASRGGCRKSLCECLAH